MNKISYQNVGLRMECPHLMHSGFSKMIEGYVDKQKDEMNRELSFQDLIDIRIK